MSHGCAGPSHGKATAANTAPSPPKTITQIAVPPKVTRSGVPKPRSPPWRKASEPSTMTTIAAVASNARLERTGSKCPAQVAQASDTSDQDTEVPSNGKQFPAGGLDPVLDAEVASALRPCAQPLLAGGVERVLHAAVAPAPPQRPGRGARSLPVSFGSAGPWFRPECRACGIRAGRRRIRRPVDSGLRRNDELWVGAVHWLAFAAMHSDSVAPLVGRGLLTTAACQVNDMSSPR